MPKELLFTILIGLMGAFSLAGAVMNWDWFMLGRKAQFFVKHLGRTGARVFYAVLGAALIGFAIYGFFHPEVMHSRRLGI